MQVIGQLHVAVALPPGKERLMPFREKALWAPKPVWTLWRIEYFFLPPEMEHRKYRSSLHTPRYPGSSHLELEYESRPLTRGCTNQLTWALKMLTVWYTGLPKEGMFGIFIIPFEIKPWSRNALYPLPLFHITWKINVVTDTDALKIEGLITHSKSNRLLLV